MWGLDELAKESQVEISPAFPIFVVLLNNEPIAYYYATPQVVIRPTVAPNVMTHREFYEVAKMVVATTRQVFGNPLWLVDDKSKLASPSLLAKVGLKHQALQAFEVE